MPARTKAQLDAAVTGGIADNTQGLITPGVHRPILLDLLDSILVADTDANLGAQVRDVLDAAIGPGWRTQTTLTAVQIRDLLDGLLGAAVWRRTLEQLQDAVAAMFPQVAFTYNDTAGTITVTFPQGGRTLEEFQDTVAAMFAGVSEVVYDDNAGTLSISFPDAIELVANIHQVTPSAANLHQIYLDLSDYTLHIVIDDPHHTTTAVGTWATIPDRADLRIVDNVFSENPNLTANIDVWFWSRAQGHFYSSVVTAPGQRGWVQSDAASVLADSLTDSSRAPVFLGEITSPNARISETDAEANSRISALGNNEFFYFTYYAPPPGQLGQIRHLDNSTFVPAGGTVHNYRMHDLSASDAAVWALAGDTSPIPLDKRPGAFRDDQHTWLQQLLRRARSDWALPVTNISGNTWGFDRIDHPDRLSPDFDYNVFGRVSAMWYESTGPDQRLYLFVEEIAANQRQLDGTYVRWGTAIDDPGIRLEWVQQIHNRQQYRTVRDLTLAERTGGTGTDRATNVRDVDDTRFWTGNYLTNSDHRYEITSDAVAQMLEETVDLFQGRTPVGNSLHLAGTLLTSGIVLDEGAPLVASQDLAGILPEGAVEVLTNYEYDQIADPDPDTLYVIPELGGYFVGEHLTGADAHGNVWRIDNDDPDSDAHGYGVFGTGYFASPCLATRNDGRLYLAHRSTGNHRLRRADFTQPFTGGHEVIGDSGEHLSNVIPTTELISDMTFLGDDLYILTYISTTQRLYRINPDDPGSDSGDYGRVGNVPAVIRNPRCILAYNNTLYLIAQRGNNEAIWVNTLDPDSVTSGVVGHGSIGEGPSGLILPSVATWAHGEGDHAYIIQYAPPQAPQLWRISLANPDSTASGNGNRGSMRLSHEPSGIAFSPHIPSIYAGDVLMTEGSDQTSDPGTGGLTQAQVDGRIAQKVEDYALTDEDDRIPYERVFTEDVGVNEPFVMLDLTPRTFRARNGTFVIAALTEGIQDLVAAMVTGNPGVTYDDNNGTIVIPGTGTTGLTQAQVDARIVALVLNYARGIDGSLEANRILVSNTNGLLTVLAAGAAGQLVGFDGSGHPAVVDAPHAPPELSQAQIDNSGSDVFGTSSGRRLYNMLVANLDPDLGITGKRLTLELLGGDVDDGVDLPIADQALEGNTGLWPTSKLGSGTRDSTTFLRGDGSFETPPGGQTTEQIQDIVGAMFDQNTGVTYDDVDGEVDFDMDDRIKFFARRHGTQSLIRTSDITPREITHELLATPSVRNDNIADRAVRAAHIPDDEIPLSRLVRATTGPALLRWNHAESAEYIPQFGTELYSGNLVPTAAGTWLMVSDTFAVVSTTEEIVLDLGWPTSTLAGRAASAHQHHVRVERLEAARSQRGSNHPTDGGAVALNQCPVVLRDWVVPGTDIDTIEARDVYLGISNVNSRLMIAFREATKYAYSAKIWWR